MCTVSLVPHDTGLSVLCNRDERHSRAAALPPAVGRFGAREALMPVDPQGGGTWIAVNDAGLVLALLNRQRMSVSTGMAITSSRGLVIPGLLGNSSLEGAVQSALALDATVYEPFTLVIASVKDLATVTSDGVTLSIQRQPLVIPVMFTSSSLDEQRAVALRGRLFRRMVVSDRRPLSAQAQFHEHQWSNCRELSVRMWRADASTVSRTTVQVNRSGMSLTYAEVPPGGSL